MLVHPITIYNDKANEGRQENKAALHCCFSNDPISLSPHSFAVFHSLPLYLSHSHIKHTHPLRFSSTCSLILSHPNHLISPALPPLQLSLPA